ncbi:hypothetical protein [Porphyromonas asaccharolytica]
MQVSDWAINDINGSLTPRVYDIAPDYFVVRIINNADAHQRKPIFYVAYKTAQESTQKGLDPSARLYINVRNEPMRDVQDTLDTEGPIPTPREVVQGDPYSQSQDTVNQTAH